MLPRYHTGALAWIHVLPALVHHITRTARARQLLRWHKLWHFLGRTHARTTYHLRGTTVLLLPCLLPRPTHPPHTVA